MKRKTSNIATLQMWQRQTLERELPTGWSVEIGEASKMWTLYTPSEQIFAAGEFIFILERITEMNRV